VTTGFSKQTHPLVSVIIAYYKQEGFIAETVRSVQQQTYPNIEIIVVDDGSPVPARSVLPESSGAVVLRIENRGCPEAGHDEKISIPGCMLLLRRAASYHFRDMDCWSYAMHS
jgi:cellulose synthase/poly-beta-1,6-N-acetylglucosamine synthase-like glycosyltransferase